MIKNKRSDKDNSNEVEYYFPRDLYEQTLKNISLTFKKSKYRKLKIFGMVCFHIIPISKLKQMGYPELSYSLIIVNYYTIKSFVQIGFKHTKAYVVRGVKNKSFIIKLAKLFIKSPKDKNYHDIEQKIFDGKVKVMEVTDEYWKIHSFIPLKSIESKEDELQHFMNKIITGYEMDSRNFKNITIYTKDLAKTKKIKFKEKYLLEDYIKIIPIDKRYKIPFVLGIDDEGKYVVCDLMDLYHTFISGQIGGGKSTLLHCIIQSTMWFNDNVMFIMADFKLVGLGLYSKFKNCVYIRKEREFEEKVLWLFTEMNRRYEMFFDLGLQDIFEYNEYVRSENKLKKSNEKHLQKLPYIVLVVDEISDLQLVLANNNKNKDEGLGDINKTMVSLINRSRASGIIMVLCTQVPKSKEVDTSIRDKCPTYISFRNNRARNEIVSGVRGTKNFENGVCKMVSTSIPELTFKVFFSDSRKHNYCYEELKKIYEN